MLIMQMQDNNIDLGKKTMISSRNQISWRLISTSERGVGNADFMAGGPQKAPKLGKGTSFEIRFRSSRHWGGLASRNFLRCYTIFRSGVISWRLKGNGSWKPDGASSKANKSWSYPPSRLESGGLSESKTVAQFLAYLGSIRLLEGIEERANSVNIWYRCFSTLSSYGTWKHSSNWRWIVLPNVYLMEKIVVYLD